jgi:hypothetical protein
MDGFHSNNVFQFFDAKGTQNKGRRLILRQKKLWDGLDFGKVSGHATSAKNLTSSHKSHGQS